MQQAAVFFEWPFIILNTSQGILLFVFIVIINGLDEWKNLLRRIMKKTKYASSVKSSSNSKSDSTKTMTVTSPLRIGSNTLEKQSTFSSDSPDNLGQDIFLKVITQDKSVQDSNNSIVISMNVLENDFTDDVKTKDE